MLASSAPSTRSLRIGGVNKSELLEQLRDSGVHLNAMAVALFSHEAFQPRAEQVTLAVVQTSVAELGLSDGGNFDEVVGRALARGYSLCPLEVGPFLRLACPDQPEGVTGHTVTREGAPPGSVTVASCPISDSDDVPKGFYLRVINGIPWLRGYRSWPGHVWAPSDVFAFTVSPARTLRKR